MLEKIKNIGKNISRLLFGLIFMGVCFAIIIFLMFNPIIPIIAVGLLILYFIGYMCWGMGYLFFPDKEEIEVKVHGIDFEKAELLADTEVALKHLDKAIMFMNENDLDSIKVYVGKAYKALGGTTYSV